MRTGRGKNKQTDRNTDRQTDRQRVMTKILFAFRNYVKAPTIRATELKFLRWPAGHKAIINATPTSKWTSIFSGNETKHLKSYGYEQTLIMVDNTVS
jgi:hypothetical protein